MKQFHEVLRVGQPPLQKSRTHKWCELQSCTELRSKVWLAAWRFARSLLQSLGPKATRKLGIWQTSPQKSRTQKEGKARRWRLLFSSLEPETRWTGAPCRVRASCPWPENPRTQNSEELDADQGLLKLDQNISSNWGREMPGTRKWMRVWHSAGASWIARASYPWQSALTGGERSLEPKAGEELCVGQALPEKPELLILGNLLWLEEREV